MMDLVALDWSKILDEDVIVFLVPIVAIIMGGIVAITVLWHRHRERLAMIERGMHPDQPPEADGADQGEEN